MPPLFRLMLVNFAGGTLIGLVVIYNICLGEGGLLADLGTSSDRLLVFGMMAITLAPAFGLACLGTALCWFWED